MLHGSVAHLSELVTVINKSEKLQITLDRNGSDCSALHRFNPERISGPDQGPCPRVKHAALGFR